MKREMRAVVMVGAMLAFASWAAAPLLADQIAIQPILALSSRIMAEGGVAGENERRQIVERLEDEMAAVLSDLRSASRGLDTFTGRPPRKVAITVDWDEQTPRISYDRQKKSLALTLGWLRQLLLGSIDAAIRGERIGRTGALAAWLGGPRDLLEADAEGLLELYETKRAYAIGPANSRFRLLGGLAVMEYWNALMMIAVLEVLPAHIEWTAQQANLAAWGCFLAIQSHSQRCAEAKRRHKLRLPREHLKLILAGRLEDAVTAYDEIGLGSLRDEKQRVAIWGGDLSWYVDELSGSKLDAKLSGQCDAETWHYLTGIHALYIISEIQDLFWARVFEITFENAVWQIRSESRDALVCRKMHLPDAGGDDDW